LGLAPGPELLIRWSVNTATASPCTQMSSWARGSEGRSNAHWWGKRRRARIARVASKIKHWMAGCADYRDLPDVEATWFVDPPYEDAGKNYPYGSSGIDYAHIASWCRSRRGQVIVCENEGATWLSFEPIISGKRGAAFDSDGKSRRRTEVMWTNLNHQKQCEMFGPAADGG